jgi:hypothetical protein
MTHETETSDELLTERLILPVTKAMMQDIKEYPFEARHESKSEAVRKLIAVGRKEERRRLKK